MLGLKLSENWRNRNGLLDYSEARLRIQADKDWHTKFVQPHLANNINFKYVRDLFYALIDNLAATLLFSSWGWSQDFSKEA